MNTLPDQSEQRRRLVTRSGRAVRPPDRYEPDPSEILEDDYSDAPLGSDSEEEEWGCGEPAQTDDDSEDEAVYSEEEEYTDEEVQDTSSEEEDYDSEYCVDTRPPDGDSSTEEKEDDSMEDVLDWETLTADASDSYSSEDDREL